MRAADAFVGTTNNKSLVPAAIPLANNPYISEGAIRYFGLSGFAVSGGDAGQDYGSVGLDPVTR